MSDERQTMRVSEAARALGIHPNTVRNMVSTGRLRDARVPGTTYLRLDPVQIRELQEQSRPLVEIGTATFRLSVPAGVERVVLEIRVEP